MESVLPGLFPDNSNSHGSFRANQREMITLDPFEKCVSILDSILYLFQVTGGCKLTDLPESNNKVPEAIAFPFCKYLSLLLDHLHTTPVLGIEKIPDAWAWLIVGIVYESYFSSPMVGGIGSRQLVPNFGLCEYMSNPMNGAGFWLACSKNEKVCKFAKEIESWMLSFHKKSCPNSFERYFGMSEDENSLKLAGSKLL